MSWMDKRECHGWIERMSWMDKRMSWMDKRECHGWIRENVMDG